MHCWGNEGQRALAWFKGQIILFFLHNDFQIVFCKTLGFNKAASDFHSMFDLNFIYIFYSLSLFLLLTLLQMTTFSPPLLHSSQPPLPISSGYCHTVVCVCGWCIWALWRIPSTSFIQCPTPLSSLTAFSLFHVSILYFKWFKAPNKKYHYP